MWRWIFIILLLLNALLFFWFAQKEQSLQNRQLGLIQDSTLQFSKK